MPQSILSTVDNCIQLNECVTRQVPREWMHRPAEVGDDWTTVQSSTGFLNDSGALLHFTQDLH